MATLPKAFDSSQHDDMQGGFEPIPAAVCQKTKFPAHVTGSELKVTKDKKGKYINFEFTILDGEYKGRKIWTNLNIINANPVAVEIAEKELATLTRACGKNIIQDTQEVHAIPFLLSLKFVPAKGDFPAKNEPSGYAPIAGSAAPAAKKETGAVDTGSDTPPWAKKKTAEAASEDTEE